MPAKKGAAAKGSPAAFERKELQLCVVDASLKSRPTLGTASLNLADLSGADRLQQSVPVSVGRGLITGAGTPKLLITIRCSGRAGDGWLQHMLVDSKVQAV